MIPDKVRKALAQYKPVKQHNISKDIPEYGDIIVYNGSHLFVAKVPDGREHSVCYLVHTYTEFITTADVLVSMDESSLPYNIVVQMDIPVNVFNSDIKKYVGSLNKSFDKERFNNAYRNNGEGQSSGGPLSALWDFKSNQGEVGRNLSYKCTSAILAEG
jgi:signal peptidase I